jgi:carboxypeptidase PM20D1
VPTLATATVNFRLLPGDSSEIIIQKVKEIINDDRVIIKNSTVAISEASPVSSTKSSISL